MTRCAPHRSRYLFANIERNKAHLHIRTLRGTYVVAYKGYLSQRVPQGATVEMIIGRTYCMCDSINR